MGEILQIDSQPCFLLFKNGFLLFQPQHPQLDDVHIDEITTPLQKCWSRLTYVKAKAVLSCSRQAD